MTTTVSKTMYISYGEICEQNNFLLKGSNLPVKEFNFPLKGINHP